MRNSLLALALLSLGVQGEIFVKQRWFGQALFGPTEDVLVFVGLALVEALVFGLWIAHALFETRLRAHHQRAAEDKAETGQSSELPDVRGSSIEEFVNVYPNRAGVVLSVVAEFVRPFLLVAVVFALIALSLTALMVSGS